MIIDILQYIPSDSHILVGLSGGVDSVVLLHLLHHHSPRPRLSAIHVHHGISPNADAWSAFCQQLCAQYQIPFVVEHVDIAPLRHLGVEAAARQLRHAAFIRQPCDVIALAHHMDDQIETLFLQLLRGAGVKGAGAMSVLSKRVEAPDIIRPLLHTKRDAIVEYAKQHGLAWIHDESNDDSSYPRNFLRHQIFPVLAQKFPAYREAMLRSTQHFAEASDLLDELAEQDGLGVSERLDVGLLRQLNQTRAKNLLRCFLRKRGAPMPQQVQLEDMLRQLCDARQDANICVAYADWQLRRYQQYLYVMPKLPAFDKSLQIGWQGEALLTWPALNQRVDFQYTATQGAISLQKLSGAAVSLRLRQGGEVMRLYANGSMRTLKNLFQEHAVPPWLRDRLPLLFCGDELVYVPNIGVAQSYQACADEAGVMLYLQDNAKKT